MPDMLTNRVGVDREEEGNIEKAKSALSSSPIYVLRDVSVEQHGESLLLSGCVDSFYHKQLAQEAVLAVAEGRRVINTIDVEYDA